MKRVIGVSRETGSDVCLGRVGGRPHNLVERPQINKAGWDREKNNERRPKTLQQKRGTHLPYLLIIPVLHLSKDEEFLQLSLCIAGFPMQRQQSTCHNTN